MDLEKELFNLQDKKYQSFQKKLCPGCENIIGIRVPTLRKFAREKGIFSKKGPWLSA